MKYKDINIGFVQGRLSEKIGSRYQHFPIINWQDEFSVASDIGFDSIEWIVSDFSNPIFNIHERKNIKYLIKKNKINISSISLDLLMFNPLYKMEDKDFNWLIENLSLSVDMLNIKRVSFPIEEQSALYNINDVVNAQKRLALAQKIIAKKNKKIISIESDLSPNNLLNFLNHKSLSNIGVTYDTGNILANGYNTKDYINLLHNKIYGLHIKDRAILFSKTVKLGTGEVPFKYILESIGKFKNLKDITLQSSRSEKNFIRDIKSNLSYIKDLM